MHRDAFQIEGIVREASPNGTWRVELPNTHCVVGFLSAALRRQQTPVRVGEIVRLEMSPFDMSKGRIIGKCN